QQNAAFFAEVFRRNPTRVAGWCKELADMPAERRQTLWMALWFADLDESRAVLRARARGGAAGRAGGDPRSAGPDAGGPARWPAAFAGVAGHALAVVLRQRG